MSEHRHKIVFKSNVKKKLSIIIKAISDQQLDRIRLIKNGELEIAVSAAYLRQSDNYWKTYNRKKLS